MGNNCHTAIINMRTLQGRQSVNKLDIINLTKRYGDFKEEATFSVPCGAVVGLIGENGAGKSTVIKSILGIVRPDGGRILFGGKEADKLTREERQKIAYVLDDTGLPDELTLKMLGTVLRNMFPTWNKGRFRSLIASLGLPESQPLKEFSKGMKMKAAIAVSLSYDSELLILDEPTSGLDPVVRDEILGMIYDYVSGDGKAVLISSHITSDLEKLCDYIVYMHGGRVLLSEPKDELLEKYAVYSVDKKILPELDRRAVVRVLEKEYRTELLAYREEMPQGFDMRPVRLDDIMLFYSKGVSL